MSGTILRAFSIGARVAFVYFAVVLPLVSFRAAGTFLAAALGTLCVVGGARLTLGRRARDVGQPSNASAGGNSGRVR